MNETVTTTGECPRELLAEADFDGELDAAQAAEQAAHRETCVHCRATYERLARVRAALRDDELYHRAPANLRADLLTRANATPAAATRRWSRARTGWGIAIAAAILIVISLPGAPDLTGRVVDDHVRALQPGHLWDVESSDRHTVKPWFNGRIDFAPPVKDLADQQFPLKGGRLDYIDGHPAAALVYEHGRHPIDLLMWPGSGSADPASAAKHGYNIVHWSENGLVFWAVSDVEATQLEDFVKLWRAAR